MAGPRSWRSEKKKSISVTSRKC